MSEFAFSGLGINPHYGTPENPHSRDVPRLPGGSSSGAGVAVAAGLVPGPVVHLPGSTLTVSLWPAQRPRQAGRAAA